MQKSPYFAPLLVALGLCLISSTKVAELVKPTTKNSVAENDFACSALDSDESTVECLEATHFVVGAGAMGMAFVDTLIHEDPNARVVLVDRESQPGGHWVTAPVSRTNYAVANNIRLNIGACLPVRDPPPTCCILRGQLPTPRAHAWCLRTSVQ